VRLNELRGEWLEEKDVEATQGWDDEFGWDAQSGSSASIDDEQARRKQDRKSRRGSRDTTASAVRHEAEEEEAAESGWLDRKEVKAVMKKLRSHCEGRFEREEEEHVAALEGLWSGVFPSERFPTKLQSPHWRTIGFREEDPCQELRSIHCSVLALHSMAYLCGEYSGEAQRIVVSQSDGGSYGFVELGFAVNEMLVRALSFDDGREGGAEHAELFREPNFYPELFAAVFIIVDQRKQKAGGGRDLDSIVAGEIFPELQKIIAKQPGSVIQIRKQLAKNKSDWSSAAGGASAAASQAAKEASKLAAKAYSKLGSLFG